MLARASALAELDCRATAQPLPGEPCYPGIYVGGAYVSIMQRQFKEFDPDVVEAAMNKRRIVLRNDGTYRPIGGGFEQGTELHHACGGVGGPLHVSQTVASGDGRIDAADTLVSDR